jgi:hypothetical protein
MRFDHQRLVRRDPAEVKKLRAFLGARRGTVSEMAVVHEHDNRCCKRESWPRTLAAVLAGADAPTASDLP